MKRKNNIKILAIILCVIVVVMLLGFEWYKYIENKKQTEIIAKANKYMNDGEYDKAISILEESLKEKYDISMEKGIDFANELKRIKAIYEDGINLFNEKRYLESIDQLKKVSNDDRKLYDSAQSKIEECKKQYIEKNIDEANIFFKNFKYDEANKCLDDVLKMDSGNNRAEELKKSIEDAIKENEINAKVEQKAKKKDQQVNFVQVNNNLTYDQAAASVMSKIKDKSPNTIVSAADKETRKENGIDYYIVHVVDDMKTHFATRGWYYVEVSTGKVYKLDIVLNKLNPVD